MTENDQCYRHLKPETLIKKTDWNGKEAYNPKSALLVDCPVRRCLPTCFLRLAAGNYRFLVAIFGGFTDFLMVALWLEPGFSQLIAGDAITLGWRKVVFGLASAVFLYTLFMLETCCYRSF